jgi:transglutaminase-like putative cysteine protease
MTSYVVSAEEALKELSGSEFDIAASTLVKVKPIADPHDKKTLVYRISTPGMDPEKFIPAGPTQSIEKIDQQTVELTVTAREVPRGAKSVRIDDQYSRPTRYLQSNDPRVMEHARRAAIGRVYRGEIAVAMEKYVDEKLAKKNFSTALASAAEVAQSLEGDCTEHAVLLAAMLRAGKIPSRIAVGLVYTGQTAGFGGHMWTEAWLDGQWIPLDATLGRGGIGAAHIKLGESSFDDDAVAPVSLFLPMMSLLGNMTIEVVEP